MVRLRSSRVGLPEGMARVPPARTLVEPVPVRVPPVQVVVIPVAMLKSSAPVRIPPVNEKVVPWFSLLSTSTGGGAAAVEGECAAEDVDGAGVGQRKIEGKGAAGVGLAQRGAGLVVEGPGAAVVEIVVVLEIPETAGEVGEGAGAV